MRKISLINTRSLRAESPDLNHNESNNHRALIKLFSNSSQGSLYHSRVGSGSRTGRRTSVPSVLLSNAAPLISAAVGDNKVCAELFTNKSSYE
uniref:Uncharacterized protein n=1 Tax=Acrobeloides nanus TaxID=290746 RepID=A0A914C8H8_9BILA